MITLVVAILAVWRATVMVTEDEGPFSVFARLRDHLDPYQKTWVGRGINCPWCVSWWVALVAATWLWYFGFIALPTLPLWWFGLSGGSGALTTITVWMQTRRH